MNEWHIPIRIILRSLKQHVVKEYTADPDKVNLKQQSVVHVSIHMYQMYKRWYIRCIRCIR